MKSIITYFLVFISINFSLAEGNVDSLFIVLKNSSDDITKVGTLEKLAWAFHRTQPQKTVLYASQSLSLSEKINYQVGTIRAKSILAVGYSINGNLNAAFHTFAEAIQLAESSNNQIHICRTYTNLGKTHMKIGNFEKAVEFYQKGAMCSEKFDLSQQMGDNLLNMAAAIQDQGVGETALKYANEALEIAISIKDETLISDAHKLLGILHLENNYIKEAQNHLEIAFLNAQERNDQVGISSIYNQLGIVYFKKNKIQKALELHRKAYHIAIAINYQEEVITALTHLSELYFIQKDYQKSIEKSKEGILLAEKFGALKNITRLYEILAQTFAEKQDFSQAYVYHTKLKTLSDSLNALEKNQKLNELKIQFELENKEAENKLLKIQQAKDKLAIQKANIASTAFVIALFGVCIITFLLFKGFKRKHTQSRNLKKEVLRRTRELEVSNAHLVKSNKEMERFNHIASHDLKEPLRNIISFSKLLESRLIDKENHAAQEYLSFVITNAKQMNTLIEDVLEFSKYSNKKIDLEEVDLSKVMQQVLTTLQPILEEKTANILYVDLPVIRTNSVHIHLLLKNIIENGISYNDHTTPEIEVSYQLKKSKHYIHITDNGIGIDPDYHVQIFDMFKRLQSRQNAEGSGLGLSICQKIANRLGGEILLESALGQGSTFTIVLPEEKNVISKVRFKKNQPIFKVLSS